MGNKIVSGAVKSRYEKLTAIWRCESAIGKTENLMVSYGSTSSIIDALRLKYKGQIAEARANIDVYIENPFGIGDHSDVVAAVDEQVAKLADAMDKLEALDYYNTPQLL